jgi:DNA repair exonuclease SbcCD ATPase subunit
MKSKLEEKIKEAAELNAGVKYEGIDKSGEPFYSSDKLTCLEACREKISDFTKGAQFGVSAYKEMLEGVGVEANSVWICFADKDNSETVYPVNPSSLRPDENGESEYRESFRYLEALPVLAKLQQQAEKIEADHQAYLKNMETLADGYKQKITELEAKLPKVSWTNEMVKAQGERITELEKSKAEIEESYLKLADSYHALASKYLGFESRLKEAESVIQFVAKPRSGYVGVLLEETQAIARQYMEKVK